MELELGFTAEFIVSAGEASGGGDSVGTILREDVPAGGAFNVCVSAGAVFSSCVTKGCVLNAGAAVDVEPSSGSVDVEVLVRYNAVCNATIAPTQTPADSQLQMPRPGKRFSIRSSPHVLSLMGTKVQPLGSLIVLTPVAWIPSGRRG